MTAPSATPARAIAAAKKFKPASHPKAILTIEDDGKGGVNVSATFDPPCGPKDKPHTPAAIAMELLLHLQQLSKS